MVHQKSNPPLLNVLGRNSMQARCIQDKCDIGNPNVEFYTVNSLGIRNTPNGIKSNSSIYIVIFYFQDVDLRIGQVLNVFGRNVVLTDCDKFTQDFYQKKYGIEEFVPISKPRETRWLVNDVERIMPPYNGWGSHEDSETNCISIEVKARNRDMKKFLKYDNCKLRFKAQMISKSEEDNDRGFVITYHLDDDTISVFEIGKRNFSSSVIKIDFTIDSDQLTIGKF